MASQAGACQRGACVCSAGLPPCCCGATLAMPGIILGSALGPCGMQGLSGVGCSIAPAPQELLIPAFHCWFYATASGLRGRGSAACKASADLYCPALLQTSSLLCGGDASCSRTATAHAPVQTFAPSGVRPTGLGLGPFFVPPPRVSRCWTRVLGTWAPGPPWSREACPMRGRRGSAAARQRLDLHPVLGSGS